MKNTMIKKINVVVSLWLIAVMVVLFIFGKELALNGFYYACAIMAAVLLASNVFTIASGLSVLRKTAVQTKKEYNNY